MSTPKTHTAAREPVRTPFRVLAGIIAITGAVAVIGISFLIWRGARVVRVGDVLMLPLMLGFVRLTYHAAAHGRSPKGSNSWPFASPGVAACYLLLLLAYQVATA
jgi:hypothetical protein